LDSFSPAPLNQAGDMQLGFIDAEGTGDKGIDYDVMLLTPTLLISKIAIYNFNGPPEKTTMLDMLATLAKTASKISMPTDADGDPPFGHLHIVFRDWRYFSDLEERRASHLEDVYEDGSEDGSEDDYDDDSDDDSEGDYDDDSDDDSEGDYENFGKEEEEDQQENKDQQTADQKKPAVTNNWTESNVEKTKKRLWNMILEHEPSMGRKGRNKRQQMRNQQRKMLTEAFKTITLWIMPSPLDGADKQHVERLDETRPEFQDQVKQMRAEMAKQLQEPTRFVEEDYEQEVSSYKDLTFKLSEQMMARAVKSMNSNDNLAPASMFEQISKAEGVQALSQLQGAVKEKWEQFKKETGVKDEAELQDIKAQMLQRKANILSKLDLEELPEDIQEQMDQFIEDKFDHINATNKNRRFEKLEERKLEDQGRGN
jgi:hypothetical protein